MPDHVHLILIINVDGDGKVAGAQHAAHLLFVIA